MSCFVMTADCIATISKTLESILNCGFNSFGFSAPSALHDALKDCRDRYGYYSDRAIFRRLYSLNLAAYNGRYSKGPSPETIPDMPEVPTLTTIREYADHHEKLLPWHYKFCKLLDCLIYQADEDATYKAPPFPCACGFLPPLQILSGQQYGRVPGAPMGQLGMILDALRGLHQPKQPRPSGNAATVFQNLFWRFYIMPTYHEINEESARLANMVNSFREYVPGSATAEYRSQVDQAAALVEARKAKLSPFYYDKLDSLLEFYSRRLAAYYNDYYRNEASCPSVMISGGSNFPVNKKRKQNARRDTLMQEYNEIQGILDKIKSTGTGPVDLTDPHAREILTDQLNAHQKALEDAKAANAYYRKHKTLDGCPGITPKEREWLTRPGVFSKGDGSPLALYGCPFPAYELQSRRGYIKRVQVRLEELDRLQAAQANPDPATDYDGFQLIRNAAENRLQIIFDEIPDPDMREKLKSNGFRWSPRNKAWQRQLTDNAERAARSILGIE